MLHSRTVQILAQTAVSRRIISLLQGNGKLGIHQSLNLPAHCKKPNKYEMKQRLEQICIMVTDLLQFCIGTH